MHHDRRNTGRPAATGDRYTSKYIDQPLTPMDPFGHGLSYTRFAIGPPEFSAPTILPDGRVEVTVEVRNVGDRSGDEVVKLYVRDVAASVARPVREFRGFERVTLRPGEARTVRFALGLAELGFYDQQVRFVVEPGEFQVWAGPSSAGGEMRSFRVVAGQEMTAVPADGVGFRPRPASGMRRPGRRGTKEGCVGRRDDPINSVTGLKR